MFCIEEGFGLVFCTHFAALTISLLISPVRVEITICSLLILGLMLGSFSNDDSDGEGDGL